MELEQYTKKELVAMLKETFVPLEYYAKLEVSFVAGGRPFAKPKERKAQPAMKQIRLIQKQAIKRRTNVKPKSSKRTHGKHNNSKNS